MRERTWLGVGELWEYRVVLAPALAALAMFMTVWAIPRMIAPWILLAYLGGYASRWLPNSTEARRLFRAVTAIVVLMTIVSLVRPTGRAAASMLSDLRFTEGATTNTHWHTVQALEQMGLRSGDRVAAMRVVSSSGLTHSVLGAIGAGSNCRRR